MTNLAARSDRNRWGFVAGLYLAGYLLVAILILVGDTLSTSGTAFYGGILLVTLVLIFLTRRVTRARRWWLVPLLASPASIALGLILLANILMGMGVVHC